MFAAAPGQADAKPFLNLDSIAAWGKFPRFCINTYRWGDRFFNGYDSTYVQGSGHRMNVKVKLDSWEDLYQFKFTDGYRINMSMHPSTSAGVWLTYMAVSIGYDMNISNYFHATDGARKRLDFQFNCALFGAEIYTITNDMEMHISRVGYPEKMRKLETKFNGFHSESFGLNLYYFFNHKHYSQAAAFAYSKIQLKSAGSPFAGFAYWQDKYDLDFTDVFEDLAYNLPENWDNHYRVRAKNYALKFGYGYNWVFHRGWVAGISIAPCVGVRVGYMHNETERATSFALSNRLRMSLIYNVNKRWFFGAIGNADTNLIYDDVHTFLTNNLSIEFSAGFRFDLW